MANEIETYNAVALASIAKINGFADADIFRLNGFEFTAFVADKGIFGYGAGISHTSITNLVSNSGVVATNTTGVGTARFYLAAAGY